MSKRIRLSFPGVKHKSHRKVTARRKEMVVPEKVVPVGGRGLMVAVTPGHPGRAIALKRRAFGVKGNSASLNVAGS
jgi:hypothetical protein